MRNTGEGAKPPLRYSLNLSSHFRVWVTVWVRQLTHILTHTFFSIFTTKKHRKPTFSMLFWSCWADSNCRPHPYQGCALPTELQQRVATTKGLEPSTSGVTGRRSNQLNYMAVYARCRVISTQQIDYSTYNVCCKEFFLAGAERFELSTRGFGDRCSTS